MGLATFNPDTLLPIVDEVKAQGIHFTSLAAESNTEAAQDSRIWEDANGRAAALAMLWRRRPTSPYLALERFFDPASVTDDLVATTLQWSAQRAQAIAQELGVPLWSPSSGQAQGTALTQN